MESRNFYLISRVSTPDHAPSSSLGDSRGGVVSISDHAPSPNSYFV